MPIIAYSSAAVNFFLYTCLLLYWFHFLNNITIFLKLQAAAITVIWLCIYKWCNYFFCVVIPLLINSSCNFYIIVRFTQLETIYLYAYPYYCFNNLYFLSLYVLFYVMYVVICYCVGERFIVCWILWKKGQV